MIPYTSDVHEAPATPMNPVARSSTMIDHVADADAGKHGIKRVAIITARHLAFSIEFLGLSVGLLDNARWNLVGGTCSCSSLREPAANCGGFFHM
jgi:hypothetical protein